MAEGTVEAPEEGAQELNKSEGRGCVEPERSPQENRATGKATKEGSERAQETEPARWSTQICKATGKAKEGAFATEEQGAVAPVLMIPGLYEEVVNNMVFRHEWRKATEKELSQLASFKTWRLEDLPAGKNLVSSRWVFDLKKNQQGEVTKFKARLVARSFSQKKGIDYIKMFALTAKYNSLQMLLAIATTEDLEIHQGDVESAYLAADLDKEIFMEPLEGVETRGKVCRVLRGLYRLKQSAWLWNRRLTSFLLKHGF